MGTFRGPGGVGGGGGGAVTEDVYIPAIALFEHPEDATTLFPAGTGAEGLTVTLREPLEYGQDTSQWSIVGAQRFQGVAAAGRDDHGCDLHARSISRGAHDRERARAWHAHRIARLLRHDARAVSGWRRRRRLEKHHRSGMAGDLRHGEPAVESDRRMGERACNRQLLRVRRSGCHRGIFDRELCPVDRTIRV